MIRSSVRGNYLVVLLVAFGAMLYACSDSTKPTPEPFICDPAPLPGNPEFKLTLCSPAAVSLQARLVSGGVELSWPAMPPEAATWVSDVVAATDMSFDVPRDAPIDGIRTTGTYRGLGDHRISLTITAIDQDSLAGTFGVHPMTITWSLVYMTRPTGAPIGGDIHLDSSNVDTPIALIYQNSQGQPDTALVAGLAVIFESGRRVEKGWSAVFDVEDFEGYRVWRWLSDPQLPPSSWGRYNKRTDSGVPATIPPVWLEASRNGDRFVFLDTNVFDGLVYHYAITTYDHGFDRTSGFSLGLDVDSPMPPASATHLGATQIRVEFRDPNP